MRVLIIEDDQRLAELIGKVLRQERLDVDLAHDGESGLDMAFSGGYDALIVDRMLPGIDGLELIRLLRDERIATPVLMLTALSELPERVEGLNAGADDYLGKPFSFDELIARLRSLLRRSDRPLRDEVVTIDDLSIDLNSHRVRRSGHEIDLTPREYALLETLILNRGHVVTRDQLLERVWGYEAEPKGNVVDLYVHYLRRKIEPPAGKSAPVVRTVRGTGYMVP